MPDFAVGDTVRLRSESEWIDTEWTGGTWLFLEGEYIVQEIHRPVGPTDFNVILTHPGTGLWSAPETVLIPVRPLEQAPEED